MRHQQLLLAAILIFCGLSDALGQEWARKMFAETSRDFGTVARGAKTEHRFSFKNLYLEDLHVAAVRSSCGCTTPQITRRDLKTFETAEIVATFNTRTFLGYRSATLTVTFDKPYYAEVQLQVAGQIRGDVVIQPGSVELGRVDLGRGAEKLVTVTHAGHRGWQITDVRSTHSHFEVEVNEKSRSSSQSAYDLLVRLKPDAPAGYIKEQLMLITNDPRAPQLPLEVEGVVVAEVSVSPPSLSLGAVQPGQKVTKNLVVRGKKPFKVLNVRCDDDCFSFKVPDADREVQLIPVTFTAGDKLGKLVKKIYIETDLGPDVVPAVIAQVHVKPPVETPQAAVE